MPGLRFDFAKFIAEAGIRFSGYPAAVTCLSFFETARDAAGLIKLIPDAPPSLVRDALMVKHGLRAAFVLDRYLVLCPEVGRLKRAIVQCEAEDGPRVNRGKDNELYLSYARFVMASLSFEDKELLPENRFDFLAWYREGLKRFTVKHCLAIGTFSALASGFPSLVGLVPGMPSRLLRVLALNMCCVVSAEALTPWAAEFPLLVEAVFDSDADDLMAAVRKMVSADPDCKAAALFVIDALFPEA